MARTSSKPTGSTKLRTSVTPSNVLVKRKQPSALGAPSQHNQASRKGKRAWRKNVDIDKVEEALEGQRAEERVTGYALILLSMKYSSNLHQL